jgi:hypothetical protein
VLLDQEKTTPSPTFNQCLTPAERPVTAKARGSSSELRISNRVAWIGCSTLTGKTRKRPQGRPLMVAREQSLTRSRLGG